jgi:ABC-type multidrug transport system fused ATPase/permease subunit
MNTERASYFTERSYTTSEAENKKDIFEYWKKILGEDTLRVAEKCYGIDLVKVLNSENYVCENNHVMSEMEKVKIELFEKPINYNYSGFKGEKLAFDNFFIPLINYGIDILKNGTSLFLTDSIIDTYANTLLERLGKISLGILMFVKCEIKDMLNMDIPYFYLNTSGKSLFGSEGEKIEDYFEYTSLEHLKKKIVLLDEDDLKRQLMFMNIILTEINEFQVEDKKIELQQMKMIPHREKNKAHLLKAVQKLADSLIKTAVFNKDRTEVNWIGVTLIGNEDDCSWDIRPLGTYLYEGMSGLAIFFNALYTVDPQKEYLIICNAIEKELFTYTDEMCERNEGIENESSGAFGGEASIMYTYEVLYKITNKEKYLDYAKKHYKILKKAITRDNSFDLVYGNAGAVITLINMYQLTGNKEYIASAEIAGDIIVNAQEILILQNNIYKDTIFLMLNKIFDIDLSYFESHSSGDIENRFNSVSDIYEFISTALISTVIDVVTAVFCGIMMITQSIPLFAVIIVMTVIQITIVMILNQKARIKVKNYIADQSALQARMVETLTNIQQIRCMRIENMLSDSLKQDYKHLIKRLRERVQISDIMESVVGAFSIASSLILYVIGGYLVCDNRLELGTLIAFVTLAGYFTGPFQTLSLVVPQINVLKETMIRLKELMNYKSNRKNGTQHINSFESMEMQQVTFSYYGSTKPDVENVSMMLKKGEKIAFVGSSGSGKTTITKLLLNVFSHYQGQILVNGEDIKQICKEDIDRIFAIVTQVPMAMNGTIRENVDITNTLTDEEIYHYLDLVELKDDIEKFPLGLNTFVGENGQNISGGQKQRIAIARALALKPEVIIFDEATSNLDPLTERRICNNLKQLHITQIVVTHRLNAIQDADTIYVVEKGKIIESGTHVELLQLKGAYYDSVNN